MDAVWQEIHEHLEQEKQRVIAEIRCYPAPIPACDVQFNHLMQRRAIITRELGHLQTVKRDVIDTESQRFIADFIDSSLCLDQEMKAAFRSGLYDSIA